MISPKPDAHRRRSRDTGSSQQTRDRIKARDLSVCQFRGCHVGTGGEIQHRCARGTGGSGPHQSGQYQSAGAYVWNQPDTVGGIYNDETPF